MHSKIKKDTAMTGKSSLQKACHEDDGTDERTSFVSDCRKSQQIGIYFSPINKTNMTRIGRDTYHWSNFTIPGVRFKNTSYVYSFEKL